MNRRLTTPIHTAAVGLGNLRFFKSPLEGPRMPWFAVPDLFTCLSMDRGLRRVFHASIRREHRDDIRMVWTETGETMIAPHFMAQGLIGALIEVAGAPASLEASYAMGGAGAMTALVAHLPNAADRVNYSIAAYRNENGIEGEFTPLRDLGGGLIG